MVKVYTLIEANTDTYVYDETWKDKLISYNGQTITYDAVGNPINYMGNALTWTMGRQLASFGNISYTYNEDGIRTSKTVDGVTTTFYLDGTRLVEQTDGTNTLHFNYDRDGEVIGFTHYYLETPRLGFDEDASIIYIQNMTAILAGTLVFYGIKASYAKKVHNAVWGSGGLDPRFSLGYYAYKKTGDNTYNGTYAYSITLNKMVKLKI